VLREGTLSDVLSFYRARCEIEVQEVYATWVKYVRINDQRRAAAEAVRDRKTSEVPPVPQDMAPESGPGRQQYFYRIREVGKAKKAAEQASDERAQSLADLEECERALIHINSFAAAAVAQWEKFYRSICDLHMSHAGGANIEHPPLWRTQSDLSQQAKSLTWRPENSALGPPGAEDKPSEDSSSGMRFEAESEDQDAGSDDEDGPKRGT